MRYVGIGTAGGITYALLNEAMDYFHGHGVAARTFVAFHNVVDDVIPILLGALLGVAAHYLRLRSRLAEEEAARANELRVRVEHVERDQAVWVVAAATLHELKNPLHAIGLLIDELEHVAPTDADSLGDLRARIRSQVERALVPLDGLKALAGSPRRGDTRASVAELAESIVRDLSPVVRESGVELELAPGADRTSVADPRFMRIILENLIANSVDGLRLGKSGGHVRVHVDRNDAQIVVDVSDDGPGLGEAARATLFRPLETGKAGGLGLGLSIARALARAMDGELAPAAVEGWSTTFRLTLPLARQ